MNADFTVNSLEELRGVKNSLGFQERMNERRTVTILFTPAFFKNVVGLDEVLVAPQQRYVYIKYQATDEFKI